MKEDNMILSDLKKYSISQINPKEQGESFVNQIHQLDGQRSNKLKEKQTQQYLQNKSFINVSIFAFRINVAMKSRFDKYNKWRLKDIAIK